ncbi:MAG: hypothetical protein NTU43_01940 [Bacteroidetes bacterium]|nr:hypothetical protein [Bacteroidota bacterium]
MRNLLLIIFTCFISSLAISQNANIQIKAFLEGLYISNGEMIPAPYTANGSTPSTIADTIVIELHGVAIPCLTKHTFKTTLSIYGIANCSFPNSIIGNSYYIVIKHRNSNETWSANPVLISSNNTSYDFSLSASKAFGNNLQNMGNGVFAIFVGDINQDGAIDFNDYPSLDISSNNGDLGYNSNDLNGDASTDFNDYPVLDINSNNGIFTNRPPTILNIGDTYGGGKIAYLLQANDADYISGEFHGIIAAPTDCNTNTTCQYWGCGYLWGCNGTYFGTSTSIGAGASNTALIVNGCSQSNIAAKVCNDLILNGYDDWYLPSKDELSKLILNQNLIGLSCGWGQPYWSSSEYTNIQAWSQAVCNASTPQLSFKDPNINAYLVRAVRSF